MRGQRVRPHTSVSPDSFWHRPDVSAALARQGHGVGELFSLLHHKAGIYPDPDRHRHRPDARPASVPPPSSAASSGSGLSAVCTRIADGLNMPRTRPHPPRRRYQSHQPAPRPPATADALRGQEAAARAAAADRQRPQHRRLDVPDPPQRKPTPSACWTAGLRRPAPSRPSSRKPTSPTSPSACATPWTPAGASTSLPSVADAAALAGWQRAIDMEPPPARRLGRRRLPPPPPAEADDNCLLAFAARGTGLRAHGPRPARRGPSGQSPRRLRPDPRRHPSSGARMASRRRRRNGRRSRPERGLPPCARPGQHRTSSRPQRRRPALSRAQHRAPGPLAGRLPSIHFGDPSHPITDLTTAPWPRMDARASPAPRQGLRCDLAAALHISGERAEARRHLAAPQSWPSSPAQPASAAASADLAKAPGPRFASCCGFLRQQRQSSADQATRFQISPRVDQRWALQ